MTTVNRVWNNEALQGVKTGTSGTNYSGWKFGLYKSRVSSGTDRPVGYRPGFILNRQVIKTKPYYWRGILIRGPETRIRKTYTLDPNYPGWETPHNYTATYKLSDGSQGLGFRSGGVWRNGGHPEIWREYMMLLGTTGYTADQGLKLLDKLRERVAGSSFNAGVALGESRRSLNMIAETSTKLFKAYKAVKGGNPVKAARVLFGDIRLSATPLKSRPPGIPGNVKMVRVKPKHGKPFDLIPESSSGQANNWLALQYGWKPLIKDIYEGAVFIDHALRRPTVFRVFVRNYGNGGKVGQLVKIDDGTYTNWKMTFRQQSKRQIVAYLSEVDTVRLSGLLDPASLAWELLPFSFVVDWFIPIGNYLSARSLAASLKGTFVTTTTDEWVKTKDPFGGVGWAVESNHNALNWTIQICKTVRTVSTTLQIPSVAAKPLAEVPSWNRAITSVALFTQQILKRR